MAKSFKSLVAKMPLKAQKQAQVKAKKLLREIDAQEMALGELRHAKELSQEDLAKFLHVEQPQVSRLEKRTDMYISTLRKYIEAVGGHMEIVASFPEGDVLINQFSEI